MYLPSGHLLSERGFEDYCAGMEDRRHWFPLTYHWDLRSWAHVCDCLCIPLSICIIVHMYTHKIHCFIRLDAFKFKVSKRANNYNIISQKVPTKINHFCQSQLHHPIVTARQEDDSLLFARHEAWEHRPDGPQHCCTGLDLLGRMQM